MTQGFTRRDVWAGGIAAFAGLAAGLPSGARATDFASLGRAIRVEGWRLRRDGLTVRLRGVSFGDPTTARAGRSEEDYRVVRDEWSSNAARLSVHPGLYRAAPTEMMDALEANVAAALAHGQHVIIDWHAIGWPGGTAQAPDPKWGVPDDFYSCDLDLSERFWREAASRFGHDGRILFELFNEPVDLDRPKPFAPAGEDWRALTPHWQRLVEIIRARSQNVVVVAGGSWAADLSGAFENPLMGDDIAYAWHVYPWTGSGDPVALAALLGDLPTRRPVIVTEWGFGARPGEVGPGKAFAQMFAAEFLERYSMSWTAWCWQPGWLPALIEGDWRTPTASGEVVQALLRS